MKQDLKSWVIAYLFGVILTVSLVLGVISGVVKISGWRKFPHRKGGVLLASNHPSLFEPLLMIALFCVGYLVHPVRLGPYTLADKVNYKTHKGWKVLSLRILSVSRPKQNASDDEKKIAHEENSASTNTAVQILQNGGNIIIFPEGSRTTSDKPAKRGYIGDDQGHKIRAFLSGVAALARESGATVVPVWNEISWSRHRVTLSGNQFWWPKKIRISIGETMRFGKEESVTKITRKIQDAVLAEAKNC